MIPLALLAFTMQTKPAQKAPVSAQKQVDLFNLVGEGDAAGVTRLLRAGANPNAYEPKGSRLGYPAPPLCYAVFRGRAKIVTILLRNGANPDLRFPDPSGKGPTPLMIAVNVDQPQCVPLLLLKGAKTLLKNSRGETAYAIATRLRRTSIVKMLTKYPH